MAVPENKKRLKSLLGALAAGETIPSESSMADPDLERFHPAEDFAVAWLHYWRAIGNHVLVDARGVAWICATMAGLNDVVPQPHLPPHLRLWNDDMRAGAERTMEVLLGAVPGARDAVRQIVHSSGTRREQ